MQITSGTRLGPYEILAPIGAGGMGEVFRATRSRRERARRIGQVFEARQVSLAANAPGGAPYNAG